MSTTTASRPPPPVKRSFVQRSIRRLTSSSVEFRAGQPLAEDDEKLAVYSNYPLASSLFRYEKVRECAFKHDGYSQFEYPAGNDGWIQTLCVMRGRALHQIALPWLFVTLHSVVVISLLQLNHISQEQVEDYVGDWTDFYGFVFNVVLSFLLIFRLNRAATRYWLARQYWGRLIANGRNLTSGILNHGGHRPVVRDESIRWIGAAAVAVMSFMRGDHQVPEHSLDGILDAYALDQLHSSRHMALYATDRIRDSITRLFQVTADTPTSLSHAWAVQLDRLEVELNDFSNQYGAMERIRGTPLPIVYVSHLRTFLLLHLILFPYVFGPNQGWATIPLTMVTAFAFLGIEGASSEVENPFKKGHVNNLNMDALTMALLQNIQQQVRTKADLELSRKGPVLVWDTTQQQKKLHPSPPEAAVPKEKTEP